MEQQELIIRQAVSEDHEAITHVLIKSYAQYEPQFTEEGWQNYSAALRAAVDNPNMELMLVAELEGKVVGHFKCSDHQNRHMTSRRWALLQRLSGF